jgi:hypothetical protein
MKPRGRMMISLTCVLALFACAPEQPAELATSEAEIVYDWCEPQSYGYAINGSATSDGSEPGVGFLIVSPIESILFFPRGIPCPSFDAAIGLIDLCASQQACALLTPAAFNTISQHIENLEFGAGRFWTFTQPPGELLYLESQSFAAMFAPTTTGFDRIRTSGVVRSVFNGCAGVECVRTQCSVVVPGGPRRSNAVAPFCPHCGQTPRPPEECANTNPGECTCYDQCCP